jgi:hypothetical protein
MLSTRGFRAQLVTQGQRELYDYWLHCAGSRPMPARSDLDPLRSVPKLLPCIGLIDVARGLADAWFRLAGTRLHDIYGEEITGKRVDQIFSGPAADYWRRVHASVVERGLPCQGVVRGPMQGRDHVVLFWLRLPLSEGGGRVDRILTHDMAAPIENERVRSEPSVLRYPAIQPQLRALPRRVQYG